VSNVLSVDRQLLEAYLLEKCVYELRYELNTRPAWVGVPLRGIVELLEREPAEAGGS
jgi:maltose alpha-D-glucosyltransferase/alpha-amylase